MLTTKTCPWTGQEVKPIAHPTKPDRMVAISPNGRAFWESDVAAIKKTRSRTVPAIEEVTDYGNTIDD